eukprot:7390772-Heterocapsa_arctica.AAC.1
MEDQLKYVIRLVLIKSHPEHAGDIAIKQRRDNPNPNRMPYIIRLREGTQPSWRDSEDCNVLLATYATL